jgi:RNA polymerase sigma factor (sigma-70 family)
MNYKEQDNPTLQVESDLVGRAMADPAAFASLFDHYFPLVHKYTFYRAGDISTADDLTAEVFERLLIALPRYTPGKAPFGAWLFGIARHVINDHHRNQKRKHEVPSEEMDHLIAPEPQPEAAALISEKDNNLLNALNKLTGREKDIIALKFAAELTNRQIAKLIGLGESHIGVILFRSMQRLRLILQDMEDKDER